MTRETHTVVILDIPEGCYDEIAARFRAAGYDHVFSPDELTMYMQGIALRADPTIGENHDRED